MTAKTVNEVLRYALSFEGLTENPLGSNKIIFNDWYYGGRGNYGHNAAWCDTFQSYVDAHCGVPVGPGPKGSAYTPAHATWFQQHNLWGQTPKLGAYVFFDFPGDGVNRISHVGRVIEILNTGVWCIEGNTDEAGGRTGGKVMKKFRRYGSYIKGYGYPQYGTGADPTPPQPTPPTHRALQEVESMDRQADKRPTKVDGHVCWDVVAHVNDDRIGGDGFSGQITSFLYIAQEAPKDNGSSCKVDIYWSNGVDQDVEVPWPLYVVPVKGGGLIAVVDKEDRNLRVHVEQIVLAK